jgi:glycerol kinase
MLNPHYGASKIRWCLENIPGLEASQRERTLVISPVASYLLFHLLDERPVLVDPANAGRTLLFDFRSGDWSEELLKVFEIDDALLPHCVATRFDYGSLTFEGARIPLQICTGDQSAAVFFSGQPRMEDLYVNVGTGAFVQQIRQSFDDDANDGLLKSIVYSDDTQVLIVKEGTVNGAGRALQWYSRICDDADYVPHLETWLRQIENPPLFFNTVSGAGSPYWFTATPRFERECNVDEGFVAIIESIVFLLVTNIRLFSDCERILISGGLSNSDRFCQYMADLSALPVCRQKVHEATAKGLFVLLSGQSATPEIEHIFKPELNTGLEGRFEKWTRVMKQMEASAKD